MYKTSSFVSPTYLLTLPTLIYFAAFLSYLCSLELVSRLPQDPGISKSPLPAIIQLPDRAQPRYIDPSSISWPSWPLSRLDIDLYQATLCPLSMVLSRRPFLRHIIVPAN